jgi:hypothetical protein
VQLYSLDDLGERQVPVPVIRDYVNQHLTPRRRPRPSSGWTVPRGPEERHRTDRRP